LQEPSGKTAQEKERSGRVRQEGSEVVRDIRKKKIASRKEKTGKNRVIPANGTYQNWPRP